MLDAEREGRLLDLVGGVADIEAMVRWCATRGWPPVLGMRVWPVRDGWAMVRTNPWGEGPRARAETARDALALAVLAAAAAGDGATGSDPKTP